MHHSKKRAFIVFWSVVGTLALVAFLLWLFYFRRIAYTDDAYVQGNQVFITPLKSGFIQAIHTDDTYLVTLGQLLVELDATDSEIALNKAKENLGAVVRDVSQKFHDVFAYQSEIEVQKAEFIKAAQDFQHREDVIARAGVSLENYEHAIAALRSSFFSLWRTETLYDKALRACGWRRGLL
jgi:membrane fusion protein (multidrug efflux system)